MWGLIWDLNCHDLRYLDELLLSSGSGQPSDQNVLQLPHVLRSLMIQLYDRPKLQNLYILSFQLLRSII